MKIVKQDILEVKSGVIVHQVNCRGAMNAGLAKAIRDKWPIVYRDYKRHAPVLGQVLFTPVGHKLFVANLYGQDGYGCDQRYTDYNAVRSGLDSIVHMMERYPRFSTQVYIPYKMGCGLAGGDWAIVFKMIEEIVPEAVICKL